MALFGGKLRRASWLDPLVGIVGAVLVSAWAYGLLRDTSRVLVDAEMKLPIVDEIEEVIRDTREPLDIADLRVRRVAKGKYACTLSVSAGQSITPAEVKRWLSAHDELGHVTVEVNQS